MSAEGKPEFVDSNVLVYSLDTSAVAKRDRAIALLAQLREEGRGAVSVQVLQEFYVISQRKLSPPLSPTVARKVVAGMATWLIHSPGPADVLAAIDLHRRHRLSYWDAMILHSAARLGCSLVWSEDLNPDQRIGGVVIRNPFAG